MSNFVRIPHRFALEPLEVMLNQRTGRILATPRDYRSWEDRMKQPKPTLLAGTWYPNDTEQIEPFDLRPEDIVEVDIDSLLNRYILHRAAEDRGLRDLSVALHENDKDLVEELLDICCQLESA